MNNFIERQIARTNRNFLLTTLLLLAIFGGALFLSFRYISNLFQGPVTVSQGFLLGLADPESVARYYVNVTADEVIPTGVVHITTRTRNGVKQSETTDAAYYALRMGDKLLVAKRDELDDNGEHKTLTGSLETLSSDEHKEIIENIESENPDMKGVFLPYKLDATPFANWGNYFGLTVLALLGALGIFNLVRWILRTSNERNHPIMKQLAKLGDVHQMVTDVNASMPADAKGKMITSPRWVAGLTEFGVNLNRTEDVVWAHVTRTQHKTYGVNTGKSFAITVYDRFGKSSQVNFGRKEDAATEFMTQLRTTVPWAILGHSDEIAKMWNKERAKLISLVDQRRKEAV